MKTHAVSRIRLQLADITTLWVRREHPFLRYLSLLVLLGLWEAVAALGLVSPLFLPPPSRVLDSGWGMVQNGEIWHHLAASLGRIGLGFSTGALVGVTLGVILGISSLADDCLSPVISATYPIPKIAIFPLLILWLGIGEMSKVAVIALGVFFPVVISVRAGVRDVDTTLIKAAVSMGSGRVDVIRKVILPAALPMIFAGLKLGVGIALLLVVTAEMIAADSGIGFLILSSADLMQTARLLFGIVVLSMMGLTFSGLLDALQRFVVRWK